MVELEGKDCREMEPLTAYAIYQGGKLLVNMIGGAQQQAIADEQANVLEKAAVKTVGAIGSVGKSFYGSMDIVSEKLEHGGKKLMHSVGDKLGDIYQTAMDAPATMARNYKRVAGVDNAVDSMMKLYDQGKKDLESTGQDMKIKAFQDVFSKIGTAERAAGSIMSKVKNLRGR
jgi:hypothetical protein